MTAHRGFLDMNSASPNALQRDESPSALLSQLEDNSSMFQLLFERSADAIFLFDPQANIFVDCNLAAVELMRAGTKEKLLGASPEDLSPPFQPDGTPTHEKSARIIALVEERGGHRFEWVARRFDGSEVPLEVLSTLIDVGGRKLTVVVPRDISERKKAERELLELNQSLERRVAERTAAVAASEARFSAAFRASPVFITIYRMDDGRYVLANEAFLKWTGYRLEEVLGHTSQELSLWADPADREPFWEELRRKRFVHERECRVRNRHGKIFTMLLSADIIEINGVPHMLTVGLDISGRKQTEAELRASEARLRESEARFSAAFQASPIITAISRAHDGTFVLANDAFLQWSGYSREEVLGRTALELGIWADPAERQLFWDEVRSAGPNRARECRLRNRHGKVSTMLASGVIIEFDGVEHLLGMLVDITQRKQAEAELLKTLAREKELNQLKSNFVSMVSHEFRTPLGIIQSSAELLRDFYQKMPADEREVQLDSIARNTGRMAGMMEEVLVLSRLDAGKLSFQPATLDLNVFCRRVLDEVLSATNHRCRIKLSLSPSLPDAEADERLLGHIFTNLLSNAVKYSEPGTTVHFAVERDGADAVCTVRDRGIGISEEDQHHLFTAFHRGSNVGTRTGTGLGLLLVKRCVHLHGGKVRLSSKIGEGTTATVRFPIFGRSYETHFDH